jgi:hypothetical protein
VDVGFPYDKAALLGDKIKGTACINKNTAEFIICESRHENIS